MYIEDIAMQPHIAGYIPGFAATPRRDHATEKVK